MVLMSATDACAVPLELNAVRSFEMCAWYAPCHRYAETIDVSVNYKEDL